MPTKTYFSKPGPLALLLAVCLVLASRTKADSIRATVRLLSVTRDTAEFEIKLTNTGAKSIFVEESAVGHHNLHVASIEIETDPSKWTYVGPKMDAAASSVFELGPAQSVGSTISIFIISSDLLKLLKDPQPKYRARLRYFQSQQAWLTFAKSVGRKSKPEIVIAEPTSN